MNNIFAHSYRGALGIPGETNRYAESNAKLSKMLREEHLPRVKYLEKDTFDSFLWGRLSLTQDAVYHDLMIKELTPGYLWAQEEGDNVSLQWITMKNSIARATFSDGMIELEGFEMEPSRNWQEWKMTVEKFQEMIGKYIEKHPIRSGTEIERGLPSLKRELELLPIVCKVTKAACEQFKALSLITSNPVSVEIRLGVDGRENEYYNPGQNMGIQLARIAQAFLYRALDHIQTTKNEDVVEEPVAPVMRSWKALECVEVLRRKELDDPENRINLGPMQTEREVRDLTSLKPDIFGLVENKKCKDLRSWLVIRRQGERIEYREFDKCFGREASSEDKLELNLDFRDGAWVLDSRFYSKV